jgi:hypothetical protein
VQKLFISTILCDYDNSVLSLMRDKKNTNDIFHKKPVFEKMYTLVVLST